MKSSEIQRLVTSSKSKEEANLRIDRYWKNQIRDDLQMNILKALSKCEFFKQIAFCGGTCIHFAYGAKRFSEDLDFDLVGKFDDCDWDSLLNVGLNGDFIFSTKARFSNIKTCFFESNAREAAHLYFQRHQLKYEEHFKEGQKIRIKLKIAETPWKRFRCVQKTLSNKDIKFTVNCLDGDSLLTDKVCSLLGRDIERPLPKGRDYFDYLYLLDQGFKVNLPYCQEQLFEQNAETVELVPGFPRFTGMFSITPKKIKDLLAFCFKRTNYQAVKEDLFSFIPSSSFSNYSASDFLNSLLKITFTNGDKVKIKEQEMEL